jgi:hypothetical protein
VQDFLSLKTIRLVASQALRRLNSKNARKPYTKNSVWQFSAGIDPSIFILAFRHNAEEKKIHQTCRGIVKHVPFLVPFETRVAIFRKLVKSDKIETNYYEYNRTISANIRRGRVFEDGYAALAERGKCKSNIDIIRI